MEVWYENMVFPLMMFRINCKIFPAGVLISFIIVQASHEAIMKGYAGH